ncbi:MAG: hypothetical protein H5T71_00535, partial [Chloroflexi bacterium]|nr:hypothetical protein [Chloroflexota bacterium]
MTPRSPLPGQGVPSRPPNVCPERDGELPCPRASQRGRWGAEHAAATLAHRGTQGSGEAKERMGTESVISPFWITVDPIARLLLVNFERDPDAIYVG